jgi:succinoglycan biosynthesis transport protein ExoP
MPLQVRAPFDVADYLAIARRRFWWLLLSVFICWLIVWSLSWTIQPTYESEALILVEQQKVPENYVASNVTLSLQDRLQSMTQQILSRTRLETTIQRFHLYSGQRSFLNFRESEDPVDQMRRDIKIELVRSPSHPGDLTAFKIRYSSGSPELAQQATNELTSMFIDENLKAQQQESESTTSFLENQLADARAKLDAKEAKVRAFKDQHMGDLPGQLQSNMQILAGLQAQLQTMQQNINGARQQRLYLQSLLSAFQSESGETGSGMALAPPDTIDAQLKDLSLRLADARARYTEAFPDVAALKEKIAELERLKQRVEKAASQPAPKTEAESKGAIAQQTIFPAGLTPPAVQIHSQLKANELEIENYQKDENKISAKIAEYQARLNREPQTEQELADISRGYEESISNYNSLLKKQMASQLATSLEQRQQGEQFRVLDPPSLPLRPSSPRHILWGLGGLAFGAFVGLGLTALLEFTRVRVWHAADVEALVPARVLIALPHLSVPGEERARAFTRWLKVSLAASLLLAIVVGNLYAFYKG